MRPIQNMARLLPFLVALATAVVIPNGQVSDASLLLPRQEQLPSQSSVCVPQCEVDSCGGICSPSAFLSRRRTDPFLLGTSKADAHSNNTLSRRVFNFVGGDQGYFDDAIPTNGDCNAYIEDVLDGDEDGYYGDRLLPVQEHRERAISFQVPFSDKPFQILSSGLVGCNVLVIVSDRAVWMAHFWQTYSNGPWSPTGLHDLTGDIVFKQRVLDHISGTPVTVPAIPITIEDPYFWSQHPVSARYDPPQGPSVDPSLFPEGKTTLYIMTPVLGGTNPSDDKFVYPKRIREIRQTVTKVLGHRPRAVAVPYAPRQNDDPNVQKSDGVALFQYDPNYDGQGTKGYRAFFERRYIPPTRVP